MDVSPEREGSRRLIYLVVGYALFMMLTGSQLATPLYRVYQAQLGFPTLTLTLIFAAYPLAVVVGLLVFGPLADIVGRWLPLAIAPVAAALGALLFATANAVAVLFIARVLQGLSVGAASGVATAALAELHPRGDRARAALTATLATAGGVAVGPLMAGVLVEQGGGPALPFVVYLVLLAPAVAAPLLLRSTGGPPVGDARWSSMRPSVPPELPTFLATTAAATVAWVVAGLFLAVIPSYVALLLDTRNLALLGGMVFLMLGSSCVAQVAGRDLDTRRAQLAGLLVLVSGLAGVVLAFPTRSLVVFIVGATLSGVGHGLTWIGATSTLNRIAPERRRADVSSTYFAIIYVGVAASVIGVGAVADAVSLQVAVYAFAAATAAAALACLRPVARRRGVDATGVQ